MAKKFNSKNNKMSAMFFYLGLVVAAHFVARQAHSL